jgi:spore coat polysaccharide biosynthesis predicted glycosyltransferase SpsG
MPALMAWADVAVTAGGITAWELAFMRVPSLVCVVARNQVGNAEGIAEAGAGVNLGRIEYATPDSIARTAALLFDDAPRRHEMSRCGRRLLDGYGVQRVVAALTQVTTR